MLFGTTIMLDHVMIGGYLAAGLLVFQLLQGKRIIRFKGRTHQKVHRWIAYALVVVAVVHGFMALMVMNQWRIG